MFGLGAAVACDEKVEAFLCGNEAEAGVELVLE